MTSVYSIISEESKVLKNGRYKLFFRDGNLCMSDGVNTIVIDFNKYYDPTTSISFLPVYENGVVEYHSQTVSNVLNSLSHSFIELYEMYNKVNKNIEFTDSLTSFISNISINGKEISDISGEYETNTLLSLEYYNEHKYELKGEQG